MKKLLVLLIAALCASTVFAQITLTQSSAPSLGESVTSYATPSDVSFTPGSGGNQSWNISGFSYNIFDLYTYVSPTGTPYADDFPNATHCADANGSYTYYRVAANGLYYLGFATQADTMEIVQISDPEALIIPFPCTMGTEWSTVIYLEFEIFPGFTSGSKDSSRNVVDGWGTLTTPDWSESALRVASHSYIQLYLNGMPQGSPSESWDYRWLTGNANRSASYNNIDATGPNFTTGEVGYTTGGTSDADPVRGPVAESFRVLQNYPNPFNPNTVLPVELAKSATVEVTIYNEMGQVVMQQSHNLTAGQHSLPIDGSAWSSGSYFAKVMAGNEVQATRMTLVK